MRLPDPPILVIIDRSQSVGSIEARALALFRGGCRWLSLRDRNMAPALKLSLLARLVAAGRDFGATVGVHGDLTAARSCGAALHLPAGADIAAARRELGTEAVIGQSCHDAAELDAASSGGADYATLGPIAESASKPGYRPAFPATALAALAAGARLPVLALGGVTVERAVSLIGNGFTGIAIMGEAMRAADPEAWFADLVAAARGAHRGEA